MSITIDFSRMIPPFRLEALEAYQKRMERIHGELVRRRRGGKLPFYELPNQDLSPILECRNRLAGSFENLVVLGIGGSALGLVALNSALRSPHPWNEGSPSLYVVDNIDPDRVSSLLRHLDPARTIVNVITKSGDTAETMASFLIFRQWLLDGLGAEGLRRRMIVTTDKEKGALRRIADAEGLLSFPVPDGVGGRFSVLTPVGLLPAALLGMDIQALLAGAAEMDRRTSGASLLENPAYLGALFHYLGYQAGRRISVMFAYADRLFDLADWYRQLWAESLGKRNDLDGAVVEIGPTPVKALGVTDQHSQLQLYKEGPDDKIFTFLKLGRFTEAVPVPPAYRELEAVGYLTGRSLEELLSAEEAATEVSLAKACRPITAITFPSLSAQAVGEFFFLMEVQTLAAGALFRINPLDQPGVEESKHYAYGLMGRPGYEHKRTEFDSFKTDRSKLVF